MFLRSWAPPARRSRLTTLTLAAVLTFPWTAFAQTATDPVEETAAQVTDVAAGLHTDEALQIECVAHEPHVIDPVAMRFDDAGRMWVVEMRDYPQPSDPQSPPNGRIVVLEDKDADGSFQRVSVFADQLLFPTGLEFWQDGIIVTLAGQIVFLRDRDGDLRVDQREVWFEGFAEQNEQLRANHPRLGPDGLVYVAGGLRGGRIMPQNARWSADDAVDLRGFDFAFDPHGGFFGRVTGNSQYGLTIDDFGNRIGCSNRNPAIAAVLPAAFVAATSTLTGQDAYHDIAAVGPASKVIPVGPAWTTSNLHAGQFSAACGVFRGLGPAIPAAMREDLWICEPTGMLVQRQQLDRQGPVGKSNRAAGPEAIAGEHPYFRPVDLVSGPDGALYLVDMARAVIEHPDWMPDELKTRRDLRWGDTLGRIWRVSARTSNAREQPGPALDPAKRADLVTQLGNRNPWHRHRASCRLLEQPLAAEATARLERLAGDPAAIPQARARAAAILKTRNQLPGSLPVGLATANDSRLRGWAFRNLVGEIPRSTIEAAWQDEAAEVRFRALVAWLDDGGADPDTVGHLTRSLAQDAADPWFQKVIAAASVPQADRLLRVVQSDPELRDAYPAAVQSAWAKRLADQDLERFEKAWLEFGAAPPSSELVRLRGWQEGLKSRRLQADVRLETAGDALQQHVRAAFQLAVDRANDEGLAVTARKRAIEAVAAAPEHLRQLAPLLDEDNLDVSLQQSLLPALLRVAPEATLAWLDSRLRSLTPSVRQTAIETLLRGVETSHWLLDRIASRKVAPSLVGPSVIERLQRSRDPELRRRAADVFAGVNRDRAAVLARYQPALTGPADARRGREFFRQQCAACHRVNNIGTDVGPDISDSRTKTPAALLTAILDPNAAIDAAYVRYTALTHDGTAHDGLLIDAGREAVVLQTQGGERLRLPRDEIESLQTPGVSLMPEGFEQTLSVDQMRDLIRFLKRWRYLDGTIPIDAS